MKITKELLILLLCLIGLISCQPTPRKSIRLNVNKNKKINMEKNNKIAYATLGAGCFWCVEACFESLKGVESVVSGYSGGNTPNPTYKEVCTGETGHAEVVQIAYNPDIISFDTILKAFWLVHDPTTLNRQGADVGTQYRSVIYYHNQEQYQIAKNSMKASENAGDWPGKYVTEIAPFEKFYPAENYHQGYFELNPDQPYCSAVVGPKVAKFRKKFGEMGMLKD